ncbi:MAG TPA: OsmC family protein [Chthoniobacteraceae bacterium]|nr:OsmC family protein [Chthoniobacteraceae bacterium]
MIEHRATLHWNSQGADFLAGDYSRAHTWRFDGGLAICAAASPHNVAAIHTDPSAVDPEEAFIAAIASCHMLTFLYLAYRAGLHLTAYDDEAVGEMAVNAQGANWVGSVKLHPKLTFANATSAPSADVIARLHHEAHAQCFIANSVKTEVSIIPSA